MIRIQDIIDKARGYLDESGTALIQKAYVYSAAAHAGQVRLSGEPYLSHPLEVAYSLAELRLDAETICAGLLHDTIEDTIATVEELTDQFGTETAIIVEGVTKISKIKFSSREEARIENIRKMILAMADDIRVLLVKLTDRLHNMRTLNFQKPVRQRQIAQETMEIYAPLANRLGLHRLKSELEDLCLKYIKPDVYRQIYDAIGHNQAASDEYIGKVIAIIQAELDKNGIKGRVRGRVKHLYSVYHKMQQQNLPFNKVYDLIAFRVVVESLRDCYSVLGLVHSRWLPVPGRFKDYISMPKSNNYQSLHTTVVGPEGERIEIQIRTEEMHRLAEFGVAAHWNYKEGNKQKTKDVDRFSWLRQIVDWEGEYKDHKEFMTTLKSNLFHDEIYILTPRGDSKELPEGATPVDFAYEIHTKVGDHCSGAKVNGKLVPLNTELKNGDTVEIITDPHRNPSRDWLKFVKSAKARTRIKNWIRTEERARSIAMAKEMLEKEGRRAGLNIARLTKEGLLEEVAHDLSLKTVEDLLSAVGYARYTPKQILNKLAPKVAGAKTPDKPGEKPVEPVKSAATPEAKKQSEGLVIKGADDTLTRLAPCCNPVLGDAIIGYISRGRGVTVHTLDCPHVAGLEADRLISVSWAGQGELPPFPVKIRILCRNISGMLGRIGMLLDKEGVNIEAGNFQSRVDGTSEVLLTVMVKDTAHLYRTMDRLAKLENIIEALRLTSRDVN